MLFAFDHTYQQDGSRDQPQAAFHVPNRYAAEIARRQPDRFKFVASVHPYRLDAVDELDRCVADGAVAVKWLPSAMGIDPGSMACDRFYQALVRHRLPLITHAGQERAVKGAHQQHFGNPLRLRRALDHGVRVVVAAAAWARTGTWTQPRPEGPWVDSFELFARMMDEPRYDRTLFADISACRRPTAPRG
jgi:mannonate dehydratase